MNKFWGHLKTITHHRHLVMRGCFRMGLIWQGLTHDLSKYSPTEFFAGVRYYQGNRSPNTAEREANGYSLAWMHHKGRNRHHFEYWTDLSPETRTYEPVDMPVKYLCEMVPTGLRPARRIRAQPIPTHPRCNISTGRMNRGWCIRRP